MSHGYGLQVSLRRTGDFSVRLGEWDASWDSAGVQNGEGDKGIGPESVAACAVV